jgi:hypothetical protein
VQRLLFIPGGLQAQPPWEPEVPEQAGVSTDKAIVSTPLKSASGV